MNILVTGANGLIGKQILRIFNDSEQVKNIYAIDLISPDKEFEKVDFFNTNIFDQKALAKTLKNKKIDVFIHLVGSPSVWRSEQDPIKDIEINLISFLNVLKLSEKIGIKRIVFSSSCQVIETLESNSKTNYGLSKYAAELYIKKFCADLCMEYCILRPSWIYGPGMVKNPIFDVIEASNVAKKEMFIAEGTALDYIYSEDVASAFLMASTEKNWANKTLNISSNISTDIAEIKKIIENILNVKLNLSFPQDMNSQKIKYDNSEALNLGWKNKFKIEDGIREILKI